METLTFLFTDIEGSTALLQRLGDGDYGWVLADHQALIRAALAGHDGTEVDTQGDAFFAVFSSPTACVTAVIEMQRALETRAWPGGEQVRVRMGVHTGEAATTATGALVGLDVHRAARVAAIAYGGQVLLSETAAVLVRDSLPPGASLTDLGAQRLKDLGRPERIFQLNAPGLPAGFPPPRSLGNPALPNNLPAQLSAFIGRDREMSDVRALAGSSRLVTLTGTGGSGKTRLALQVAAELLDGAGDGVWLVELAAVTDGEAVPAAICAALGIGEQPGRAVLDGLLDALAFQFVLIVLDNCEHLIGACAKTAEAVLRRCPGVHLLVTSREPLGIGGESIYRVPPLSLPEPADPDPASCDAIGLLAERAREQGVDLPLDEETVRLMVSVCGRLDGLPLAIELAAARLRSLSLASLRDRLDQRFRLLTGGSRTALARQQTLRATVDWSYSLLNPAEQALLRLLSVFAGDYDLDAVEAVCGSGDIEAFDTADLLGSLVDKSLVVAEPAGETLRYRLLETIRQFAAERLAEAGDEPVAARAAHGRYFLALAETAGPYLEGADQGRWFARLDADYANLRRAAEHAAGHPDGTARVLRYVVALRGYWLARSRCRDALGLLLPVLDRPEAGADPRLFGAALVTVTCIAPQVDIAPARQYGGQAVELARQLGDDRLLADALGMLAAMHFFAGEPDRGLRLSREAVDRARRLGDDVLLGRSLMICLLAGDLIERAQSARLLAEAISCASRSGNQLLLSFLHNNAADHALRAGDIPAARTHLDQAAQAARATGQENPAAAANLGWADREAGHPDEARSWFEACLRIARRNGAQPVIACAVLGLACVAADRGDWDRSALLLGVAQAFLDRSGEPWQELETRYRQDTMAQVRAHLGDEPFDRAYARGMALSADEALPATLGRSAQLA
ncbi:MAG TPA: adenylate/guanylate cyclase domain-containing protein [Streptosporangiaceae bacterium]|nr:adenylate/guanylate cyclase domain-containing protein [Streptosporangiaceae bacterium]